jgi:hypothetical protein
VHVLFEESAKQDISANNLQVDLDLRTFDEVSSCQREAQAQQVSTRFAQEFATTEEGHYRILSRSAGSISCRSTNILTLYRSRRPPPQIKRSAARVR